MTKEEDIELFRQAMRDVKPLKPTDKIHIKSHEKQGNFQYRHQQAEAITPTLSSKLSIQQKVSAHEVLSYAQTGLAASQYACLKNGQISIQAQLDLHGYTVDKGLLALEYFFNMARDREYRCLRIIHGKGNNALIKNATFAFLQTQPDILAFHSAPPRMGGAGAVLVLLKK